MGGKWIQSITERGITYLDENNEEKFIDLLECYKNFLRERLNPQRLKEFKALNNMSDDDLLRSILSLREWREVGARDVTRLYLEFYTVPKVYFEFENEKAFRYVQHTIAKRGWMTFDLS